MKQSEMLRHLTYGKRTPYYDAVARLTAHHEAGHVVVGHALGRRLLSATLVQVRFEELVVQNPLFARTKKEKSSRIAALRRAIAVTAGGHVAATIHQGPEHDRLCGEAKRAYSTWWEYRASLQIQCNFEHVHDPATDSCRIARVANTICLAQAVEGEVPDVRNGLEGMIHDHEERRDAEVLRAEERAERLLKRHWQAVCDVANALHRSRSGVLKGKQVLGILAPHFGPHAMAA